jgi:hypothetical protein
MAFLMLDMMRFQSASPQPMVGKAGMEYVDDEDGEEGKEGEEGE